MNKNATLMVKIPENRGLISPTWPLVISSTPKWVEVPSSMHTYIIQKPLARALILLWGLLTSWYEFSQLITADIEDANQSAHRIYFDLCQYIREWMSPGLHDLIEVGACQVTFIGCGANMCSNCNFHWSNHLNLCRLITQSQPYKIHQQFVQKQCGSLTH